MEIIAGDVGGTKTHLVYADLNKPGGVLFEARYNSTDFQEFIPLLDRFIRESGRDTADLQYLSLALPGVINKGIANLTNLPWVIDSRQLKQAYKLAGVHFINDFQASALGTLQLSDSDYIVLHPGVPNNDAIRVAVGAGTGLGVSWIDGSMGHFVAHATEGGHIDFAPTDTKQVELLRFLQDRHGHVSYERLLSGSGLVTLYEFCSGKSVDGTNAAWVNEAATAGDEIAGQAMRMFVRVYGAYVGNLALLFKPENGIYITGGIAAKMVSWMQSEDFLKAYYYKGRMQRVVEQVAVFLVTNERVGVMGAMSEAYKLQQVEK